MTPEEWDLMFKMLLSLDVAFVSSFLLVFTPEGSPVKWVSAGALALDVVLGVTACAKCWKEIGR